MASNKIDARQSRLTSAQGMLGSLSGDTLDTIFPKINDEIAKLFEDRNALLTDGGIITFTGTALQFTESLKISLNSKIDGSVQVFDLGSTTRSLSASGRMIYAVIDRTAGTATVTADANALPAVTAANQEVFLIAKRVDATDGTQRVYFRNGSGLNAGQSVRLGASGTGGSGSGTGDDLNALTFKASFTDVFEDIPTASTSAVDTTAGKTDATLYSAVNALFQLNYDASRTVTGTGTSMNLSGTPSFTVKVGDILVVGTEARRITVVTTQTSYTIESAFTTNPTAAQATVSQAVYSKDLNNFAGDGLAISTAFSSAINQIMAVYEDTSMVGDKIFDANTTPVIGFSASSDGSLYSPVQTRPTNLSESIPLVDLPSAGTNLFLRFFANKTSGSGTVNVLGYKVFLHRDNFAQDGSQIAQSYGLTNGAGTEINIVSIGVVGGKTRIKKTWSYPVAVNPGTTNGALKVYLNGQKIPRFVDSTITPDASYKEIDQNTIELDQDYSLLPLSIEIVQDVAVVDASDTNTTNISQIQETSSEGFQAFVKTSSKINATTTTGTPAAGTFYSTIQNRAPISDLTQDLKARMGVERIVVQNIYRLQNEFGPNGEPVWGAVNDAAGQIRFVGGWVISNGSFGNYLSPSSNNLVDYLEITFYGTGLNLLSYTNAAYNAVASVDGGTEGANIVPSGSGVLSNRNYTPHHLINVVSNLSPGVHTVRIRNNSGSFAFIVSGFEILNEASTIKVQPGTSYVGGKKYTTNTQQSIPYNTTFESGVLGTRGGRVVVYQKADGTIAKAAQPVDASQLNLASANHQNEEIVRTHHFREFGAGRSDDFSISSGSGNYAFTLDDGTTSLVGSTVIVSVLNNLTGISFNSSSAYLNFTFVGTGLDVVRTDNSTSIDTNTVFVNGSSIGSLPAVPQVGVRTQKIVSGLPYGTHTVRILRTSTGVGAFPAIANFIVYQPKKPTLPAGAIELADYNVMADYVQNGVAALDTVATGVLRKTCAREFVYVNGTGGTTDWSIDLSVSEPAGIQNRSDRQNAYMECTFFGTGFELRNERSTNRGNAQLSLQSLSTGGSLLNLTTTNFPTIVTSSYSATFNTSTGIANFNGTSTIGAGVSISSLPLGLYKLRVTNTTANVILDPDCIDIITPIHSAKSNTTYDQQNTMPVGSNAISDNRALSPIKDAGAQIKNVSQAIGIQSGPTTTSTSMVPLPDLSVVHTNRTGRIRVSCSVSIINNGAGNGTFVQIFVDGVPASPEISVANSANFGSCVSLASQINVAPGVHKVDIYWRVGGGTSTAEGIRRNLLVEEV